MTTSIITKTLQKLESEPSNYSLGFRRLTVLPSRVRMAFNLASNIENNWNGAEAHEKQKSFLGTLTNEEFINWMKLA